MFVLFVCLFFFCGEPRRPSAKGTLAAAVTKKRRKTKDERRLTFVCASRSRPRGSSHPSASASASASQETRMAVGRSADVSISRSHWPETSPVGVARSHGAPATSAAEGGSGEPPLRCPSIFIDLFFFLFFFLAISVSVERVSQNNSIGDRKQKSNVRPPPAEPRRPIAIRRLDAEGHVIAAPIDSICQ